MRLARRKIWASVESAQMLAQLGILSIALEAAQSIKGKQRFQIQRLMRDRAGKTALESASEPIGAASGQRLNAGARAGEPRGHVGMALSAQRAGGQSQSSHSRPR